MEIKLPGDVIEGLPSPDSNGLVRVSVAIRLPREGSKASIVEINDVPVGESSQEDKLNSLEMPTAQSVAQSILG